MFDLGLGPRLLEHPDGVGSQIAAEDLEGNPAL